MDDWIKKKIGLAETAPLSRSAIETYQVEKLRETLDLAKNNSAFYAGRLAGIDVAKDIKDIKDVEKLPFMDESDLRQNPMRLLCVRPDKISRIVTLSTSGSGGEPKRVYFTAEDQELTIDFFNHGMRNLVNSTDTVMVLLPCERPGSVGDLLHKGLCRLGARSIPYGFLPRGSEEKDEEVLALMEREGVTSAVGGPIEIARLAGKSGGKIKMKTVLLSTEYVSAESREAIKNGFGCRVFEHYGMTEMGLGGAVSCHILEGCHPREADILFEIIDPQSEKPCTDGEWGEVVFSTLTREGMPFIRYRTGDISRFLPEKCPCGSVLKRLDRVGDRPFRKNRA